jgi:hypothetical protein
MMRIEKYIENKHKNLWDDFVLNKSKNGTVFHTQQFLSYHPKDRFKDNSILIFNKNKLKAVLAAIEKEDRIISHQGSTYGGLIVENGNSLSDSCKYYELLDEYYKKDIYFRKNEYIFDKYPSQELEFAALMNGYKIENIELSTCLDFDNINLNKGKKWEYSRCNKNLNIVFDDKDYSSYYLILEQNLQKHNSTATHTLEEMQILKRLLPNNYFLVSAYIDDIMIAGVWVVVSNNKTLHTFYISQNYEFNKEFPLTCIVNKIIKFGQVNNYKYLNFGISTEDGGKIINEGLFRFKESFGGFGVNRIMYKKENR